MESIIAHVQEHAATYALIAACVLPVIYLTRRYSMPVIMWAIELVLYFVAMHIVVHFFVRLVRWFRLSTIPHYEEIVDPGWQTPLVEFWDRALYIPEWIFYAEGIAVLLMIWAMIRYRPIKTQRFPERRKKNAPRMPSRYGPQRPTDRTGKR